MLYFYAHSVPPELSRKNQTFKISLLVLDYYFERIYKIIT